MKWFAVAAVLVAILSGGSSVWSADAENCKDHPLFTRMSSYEIYSCATTEFDAVGFPRPELADNRKEDGRALNRRVEVVKK